MGVVSCSLITTKNGQELAEKIRREVRDADAVEILFDTDTTSQPRSNAELLARFPNIASAKSNVDALLEALKNHGVNPTSPVRIKSLWNNPEL